jgi:hypothetical protein
MSENPNRDVIEGLPSGTRIPNNQALITLSLNEIIQLDSGVL